MKKQGFTLIELIMVIVILGILAAVAIPQYFDLKSDANTAAEKGVVGGVRAGIQTYFAKYKAWPTALGNTGAASDSNPLFGDVLSQGGVTDTGWSESSGTYTGPAANTYAYDSSDGSFN